MLSSVTEAKVYSVVESVIRIIAKEPQLACGPESNLLTDLGLSSINVVMLLTEACEQLEFDIFNFSESDLSSLKTVGDLVRLLEIKGMNRDQRRRLIMTEPAAASEAKRFLQVEGGYYEVGYQHGSAYKDEMKSFIEDRHAQVSLLRATPLDECELRQQLDAYLERIARERSDIAAEIYGLAEGAGIEARQACLLQVRRELIGYRKIPTLGDCSTIASTGAAPFLAQTVDLSGQMAGLSTVVRIDGRGRGAPDILMFTFKGLLGYLGMNSAGLCVGINMVLSGEWGVGIPAYLAVRLMLECRSVEQCIALLSSLPLASSRSFTLLDAKRLVMVEVVQGRVLVVPQDRPVAAHTNHFLDPRLAGKDEMNILGRNSSLKRLTLLETYLASRREIPTAQGLMALLSSHDLYPDGLCVHNKGDLKREQSVAAVVMQPREGRMWVKFGQPCESAAVEFRM